MMEDRFVGYLRRSAEQIQEDLKAKFPIYLPEITDIDNDPLFILMRIWAGIAENLHYYLDKMARETFLSTCQKLSSAILIAEANDYRRKGVYPASADITFYFDNPTPSNVLIPQNTIVSTGDGITFLTTQNVTILAGETEITVSAIQYERFDNILIGTTNGTASQAFTLPVNVVDYGITLQIGSQVYGQVDTFYYSRQNDTHFIAYPLEDGTTRIVLGDGVSGKIPQIGEDVLATYFVSQGTKGNVSAGKITEIISSISVPTAFILKCTNRNKASGGVDIETLYEIKKRIPYSRYTLARAVTVSDYIHLAELYPGVWKANVEYDCQNISLFIYPIGGGIASSTLLSSVKNWLADKKTIGHNLQVFSAGEIKIKLKVEIQLLPNYVRNAVLNTCKNRILDFFNPNNQKVGGDIQIGDIYEVMETTEGVRYSKIEFIYPIPYARPENISTPTLNWQIEILSGSIHTIKWQIIFSSSTTFQLIKNNSFFGNFSVNVEVATTEIKFTIFGSYTIGNSWSFTSYRYNGSVILEEQSMPILIDTDLEITAKGGIGT